MDERGRRLVLDHDRPGSLEADRQDAAVEDHGFVHPVGVEVDAAAAFRSRGGRAVGGGGDGTGARPPKPETWQVTISTGSPSRSKVYFCRWRAWKSAATVTTETAPLAIGTRTACSWPR